MRGETKNDGCEKCDKKGVSDSALSDMTGRKNFGEPNKKR